MSNRYYRRNNNNIMKNYSIVNNIVDELKNIILAKINGIQQKLKFLSSNLDINKNNIYLKIFSNLN